MKRERDEEEEEALVLGPETNWVVKGTRARLFRDDYLAEELEKGRSLNKVVCGDHEVVWMDRWDVRNLLGAQQPLRSQGGQSTSSRVDLDTDLTERERRLVEEERYGDLLRGESDHQREENKNSDKKKETEGTMDKDSHPFSAWWGSSLIPNGLRSLVPSDSKGQKILLQAARFIRSEERGSQIEVVLRVKQGNNPNFNFLFPEDRAHPLLRWLTDSPDAAPVFGEKPKDNNESSGVVCSRSGITSEARGEGKDDVSPIALVSAEYNDDSDDPDTDLGKFGGGGAAETTLAEKQIIEKTAQYVGKKGEEFEKIIKGKERTNAKFGFLFPWHPQNVHYLECLRKCRSSISETPKLESNSPELSGVAKEGKVLSPSQEHEEEKDAELKTQRLQRVRQFFREKQGQKIKDIQIQQHSAIKKVEAERKKRLKNLANLHNIFS